MKTFLFFSLLIPQFGLASRLFYFEEKSPTQCEIKTIDVQKGLKSIKVLQTIESCPSSWIWFGNKVIYLEKDKMWITDKTFPKKRGEGIKIPNPAAFLWVHPKTENPMASYMVEVKDSDVRSKQENDELTFTYTFEGKEYSSNTIPSWGTAFMAISDEWNSKKKSWSRREIKPTRGEAGDTPALDVLEGYQQRTKKGKILRDIMIADTCFGRLNCQEENPAIKKLLGEQEGYGSVKVPKGGTFAFATMFGDSNHASPPVYFCKSDCKKGGTQLNEITSEQISISVSNQGMVLIGEEYDNDSPKIFDGRTGNLLLSLPEAKNAVWLE